MRGLTILFALLLFGGGLAAYVRKGSTKSLLVASAVAVLLLICASLMGHPTSRSGTLLALGERWVLGWVGWGEEGALLVQAGMGWGGGMHPTPHRTHRAHLRPPTPRCRAATCLGLGGMMGYRARASERLVTPPALVALLSALMSVGYARTLA